MSAAFPRLRTLAVAAFACLALVGVPAGAATAGPHPGGARTDGSVHARKGGPAILRNYQTDRCLDNSNAYGLRVVGCNNQNYQKWRFVDYGVLGYEVINVATGRCLDHSAAYGLRTVTCNGYGYQRWRYDESARGPAIRNVKTGKCMDDSKAYGLRAVACNGQDYQNWANIGQPIEDYPR